MENQSREKKRAYNIIWNASEDYGFQPDFETYDVKGEAELYCNYITGAVRKYYDYSLIQHFFNDLKADPDHVFYESLTWLALENCTFEKGRKERPVLEQLRRSYAEKVVRKEDAPSFYYLVDEIKLAHFQRVLGEECSAQEHILAILNELELHESLDTQQIINRMHEIIDVYFPLNVKVRRRRFFQKLLSRGYRFHFGDNGSTQFPNPFRDAAIHSLFNHRSADEASSNQNNEGTLGLLKKRKPLWRNLKDHWDKQQRAYIQHYYGSAILSESQIKTIEKVLCTESHQYCRLHITRGEFGTSAVTIFGKDDHKEVVINQRKKNKTYFQENKARNSISIERLTNVIRTAMFAANEASTRQAKDGNLVAGNVWRNIYLNDSRVFQKNIADEIGNLTVDIMLDASGSQLDRQEIIASQGYIIAESLTRCRIPVRMYSFCTNRNFCVINLFRDYDEASKNEMVFHYYASGCNRDGFAIRTALHMMKDSEAEHKILIILSDGKPLDPQGIPGSGFNPDQYIYADAAGISDTAAEVRKGQRAGTIILCVFTGAEEDVPAAKKIYGNNMVCIKSPDKFADLVGILIRNVLRSI